MSRQAGVVRRIERNKLKRFPAVPQLRCDFRKSQPTFLTSLFSHKVGGSDTSHLLALGTSSRNANPGHLVESPTHVSQTVEVI